MRVARSGAGSASPVVSITTRRKFGTAPEARWKWSSRSVPRSSPATLQQMHPLGSTTTFSLEARTSAWSIGISPHSFTRTAVSWNRGSARIALRSVVLPLPRKPVRTVTGVTALSGTGSALPAARARMGRVVDLGEVLEVEVRIDLGGSDARVAEHLLHRAQVARRLEHVRGERMAKHVRVHVHGDAGEESPALDAPLHLARREPPAALSTKSARSAAFASEARAGSHAAMASSAGRPTGTIRVLDPLPVTRTSPVAASTASM